MSFSLDPSIRPHPLEYSYEKNLALYNGIVTACTNIPARLNEISTFFDSYNNLLNKHEQNRKKLEIIEPDFAMEYTKSSILTDFNLPQLETHLKRNIKLLSEKAKALPKVIITDVTKVGAKRSELLIETSGYLILALDKIKEVLDELKSDSEYILTEIETQQAFLKL